MLGILAFCAQAIPGMPVTGGWLAPVVLALLGMAAAIDARTARVPDSLVFASLFFTVAAEGFLTDWIFAGEHLAIAFAAGILLYLANELWYRSQKCDAFGMGDAKWTVVAVTCFGPEAGLMAWVIGAWLALGWMGVMRLRRHPIARVHFAPFLFAGLCVGIYWLRLR